MALNHRILRLAFAFSVGLLVAFSVYRWISDTDRSARRAIEESVVLEGRRILQSLLDDRGDLQISDALDRVRAAGKAYVFPVPDGWELSGHYRRGGELRWHPYLMKLDSNAALRSLAIEDDDPVLVQRAADEPRLSVSQPR